MKHFGMRGVILTLMVAFAGCGGGSNPITSSRNPAENAFPADSSSIQETSTTPQGGDAISQTGQTRQIGTGAQSIANEAKYAVNHDAINHPYDAAWLPPNDGSTSVSNWAWLSTQADAGSNGLRFVLDGTQGKLGYYVSYLLPDYSNPIVSTQEPNKSHDVNYWIGQLSSTNYTMNYKGRDGKGQTGVGHGTTCTAFVTMVLYRSVGYRLVFGWSNFQPDSQHPLASKAANNGDVVFYNGNTSSSQHVGICVRRDSDGLWIGDSNYVYGNGHEVIALHKIKFGDLDRGNWRTWVGKGIYY